MINSLEIFFLVSFPWWYDNDDDDDGDGQKAAENDLIDALDNSK